MTGDAGAGNLCSLWGGAWDPHDPSRLCTVGGNDVQVQINVHCLASHSHLVQLLLGALHSCGLGHARQGCCKAARSQQRLSAQNDEQQHIKA